MAQYADKYRWLLQPSLPYDSQEGIGDARLVKVVLEDSHGYGRIQIDMPIKGHDDFLTYIRQHCHATNLLNPERFHIIQANIAMRLYPEKDHVHNTLQVPLYRFNEAHLAHPMTHEEQLAVHYLKRWGLLKERP